MGVDLNLILPNDCKDLRDNKHALNVFNNTIDKITSFFGGRRQFVTDILIFNSDSKEWEEFGCNYEEDMPDYSFSIPLLSVTFYMKQGYWEVWTNARYYHYFWPFAIDQNGNPILWARYDCFNAARVLGFSEGWVCDDYHSWNCKLGDEYADFEAWLNYGEDEEDAIVHEFTTSLFGGKTERYLDYASKFHDSFRECFQLVELFKRRFPQYKVLTIGRPNYRFALVSEEDNLFVVNIETGDSLTDFPIDNCKADYNGAGFAIFNGESSAFFSPTGIRLTDFRVGDFEWRWSVKHDSPFDQIITDMATGKQFFNDGSIATSND
ncbi:hypothetical protein QYZ87_10625 [Porphyromonadaceae bacterium W3.11]|nr:hypothetical protein [Porphyromonadaceae bacterium W3.11]